MHDADCDCELCREYSDEAKEMALQRLATALARLLQATSGVAPAHRAEMEGAEVVRMDAGLPQLIPAVVFRESSRLARLKACFTYDFLLENDPAVIAEDLHSQVRERLQG